MSKEERFEIFNEDGKWVIKDNEQLPHLLDLYKSCVRLNEFVNKIADLEEKLANSVRPKFKVNDKIFVIVNDKIEEYYIDEVLLKCKGTLVAYRDICKETTITEKNEIFATKEEALAKLEEVKGEKK